MKEFTEPYKALTSWALKARTAGWLPDSDIRRLTQIEQQDPGSLFASGSRRPLVVGLFGGTGVGKSSLLNRLAGSEIAKAGIQRPTSRQATLYLHDAVELTSLPADSPADRTRISHHHLERRQQVAWLDMPDMDSVEPENRELVLKWLPYVDLVIYVVSPERYRDDVGWKILRQRWHRHHWIFVMNRWDESRSGQLEAFGSDLRNAGFRSPLILRTSCTVDAEDDEFDRLEQSINQAIDAHGLAELQRIGVLARIEDLKKTRDVYAQRFGSSEIWHELSNKISASTERQLAKYKSHLLDQSLTIAQQYPGRVSWWRQAPALESMPEPDLEGTLWDDQTKHILEGVGSEALISANEFRISTTGIVKSIEKHLSNSKSRMVDIVDANLKRALVKPGTPIQRGLCRVFSALTFGLPLATAAWVVFHAFGAYQSGLQGGQEFLGLDFALHSLLLVLLSWFVPFLLARWSRPTLRAGARLGLGNGIAAAVDALRADLSEAQSSLGMDREKLLQSLPVIYTPTSSVSITSDSASA